MAIKTSPEHPPDENITKPSNDSDEEEPDFSDPEDFIDDIPNEGKKPLITRGAN